ncbi:hypothetical protein JTB14_017522 [Gonioctena quinquepunctata]|nr:hypothetical protein JTB14_017522 [Gonioctena quinquepunctata]
MPIKPIFSQDTGGVKVGILPINHQEVLLTMKPMESVEETILDKVIQSGKKTHFHSLHNRPVSGKTKENGANIKGPCLISPGNSGIKQSAVSTKEQAEKLVPQTERKAKAWSGMRKDKKKAPRTLVTK